MITFCIIYYFCKERTDEATEEKPSPLPCTLFSYLYGIDKQNNFLLHLLLILPKPFLEAWKFCTNMSFKPAIFCEQSLGISLWKTNCCDALNLSNFITEFLCFCFSKMQKFQLQNIWNNVFFKHCISIYNNEYVKYEKILNQNIHTRIIILKKLHLQL